MSIQINSTALNLEGLAPASGSGIEFPAAQNSSSNVKALDDYEENTYTPTVTAGTGSITSVTSKSGYYTKIGNLVKYDFNFTITTNGTGASYLIVTLPFYAVIISVGAGRCNTTGGEMLQVVAVGATCSLLTYNNGYPGRNGEQIFGSVTYKAAT